MTITDVGGGGSAAALGFTSGTATGLSTIAGGATATLANQNVLTVAGANSTISSVDAALATVSAFQSQLGAIQNRFTAAVSNLQSTAQNLTQSRSTIQDADFAAETANLTKSRCWNKPVSHCWRKPANSPADFEALGVTADG